MATGRKANKGGTAAAASGGGMFTAGMKSLYQLTDPQAAHEETIGDLMGIAVDSIAQQEER